MISLIQDFEADFLRKVSLKILKRNNPEYFLPCIYIKDEISVGRSIPFILLKILSLIIFQTFKKLKSFFSYYNIA